MPAEPGPSAALAAADTAQIRFAGVGDEAGHTLDEQLAPLAELGWNSIELRTVAGVAVADLDASAFARLASTLARRDVHAICLASRIGDWSRPISGEFAADLDELAVLTDRCLTLGTRYVRVMSYVNDGLAEREWGRRACRRLRELAGRAEQAGLVLVHENCTGWASVDAQRMLELVEAVDSPGLGLLFDTGNGLAYGYRSLPLLAQVVDHVRHVHVKDARGGGSGGGSGGGGGGDETRYVPPGSGETNVAECLRLLLTNGYTGAFSLEPHVVIRPHEAPPGGADRGSSRRAGFLACAAAFQRLVREHMLDVPGGWTAVPGGIARETAP